jgi:hypothetical protein
MSMLEEKSQLLEKLKNAREIDVGITLIHAFVLDLLGKESHTAAIFSAKVEEDFKPVKCVSKKQKYAAWFILISFNLFIAYFAITMGYLRGVDFQRTFVKAAILQFIFEVVFYETTECIFMNYFIPQIVFQDFQKVYEVLQLAIHDVFLTGKSRRPFQLNVSNYLFVSTSLSFYFPDLTGIIY